MNSLNRSYAIRIKKSWNKRASRIRGHLFEERFKTITVNKDIFLLAVSRYIHLNPCIANIVKLPENYELYLRRNVK